jgi:hypothetical protein
MRASEQPQFPLYIPSKGRHTYLARGVQNTSRALSAMGVKHYIVVEPQEVDAYRKAIADRGLLATVLELDLAYKRRYELCDEFGLSKNTGSGPARNFAWDHAFAAGYERHWIMDDNIRVFVRYNLNRKIPTTSPAFWRAMEDFCLRYTNVAMAGPQYYMFITRKSGRWPPFITNTRIYSCNLIRNDLPFRWRGRYNEDTILSLDMLKAGWCTVLFNAFLQDKVVTQHWKGGNTDELYDGGGEGAGAPPGKKYSKSGTIEKSRMLAREHPDVASVVFKFDRWHHFVDYRRFKQNVLIRKPGVVLPKASNEYGMKIVKVKNDHIRTFSRKAL